MMPLALISPEILFLCISFFMSLGALLIFSIV